MDKLKPFLNKLMDIREKDPADFEILDIALKNNDMQVIQVYAKEYGFEAVLETVRSVLNEIYVKARIAKFKVNYRDNYFPRAIKDTDRLITYLHQNGLSNIPESRLQQLLEEEARRLKVSELSDVQIMDFIKALITRNKDNIIFARIPQFLQRTIPQVTPEMNNFYKSSIEALTDYVYYAHKQIALRKFFGLHDKALEQSLNELKFVDEEQKTDAIDKIKNNNINTEDPEFMELLVKLISSKYQLTTQQEIDLIDILNARFNVKATGEFLSKARSLGYLTGMANFISALTQLKDLFNTFYISSKYAPGQIIKAFVNKERISTHDIGVDQIGYEFADGKRMEKTLSFFFKITGLNKLDNLSKTSYINTLLLKYHDKAVHNKFTEAELDEFKTIFDQGEYLDLIEDLKAGNDSDNVKYLLFYKLCDIQPITLSEMPLTYLKSPNGRLCYMFKTFSLKQFNYVTKRHFKILFTRKPTDPLWIKAFYNLMRILALQLIVGIPVDYLKDLCLGRKFDISDSVWNNMAGNLLITKYDFFMLKENGLQYVIMNKIIPPLNYIWLPAKDVWDLNADKPAKEIVRQMESWTAIPGIGKFLYWFFGKGHDKTIKSVKHFKLENNVVQFHLAVETYLSRNQYHKSNLKKSKKKQASFQ